MAVTQFQSGILRLLAEHRKERGESYVAGGVALNVLLSADRRSRDIDLFHDTTEALAATWSYDREILDTHGYDVSVLREAPSFAEAMVSRDAERTELQWARDSAYRFFPLIEHELLGLTLHPFDLATNKVLAMAGRVEVRDWIDVLNCDIKLQPLGYLIWAACGKDPGYNPQSLLAAITRLRYSRSEVDSLEFDGPRPDASELGRHWHDALAEADRICEQLPISKVGTCVISHAKELFDGDASELSAALQDDCIYYHEGTIGGSWPKIL